MPLKNNGGHYSHVKAHQIHTNTDGVPVSTKSNSKANPGIGAVNDESGIGQM